MSYNLEGRGSYWDKPSEDHSGMGLDALRSYGLPRRNFRHVRLHQAIMEIYDGGMGPMFLLTQEDTDETDWFGTVEPLEENVAERFKAGEYDAELMCSEFAQRIVAGDRPADPCYVLVERSIGARAAPSWSVHSVAPLAKKVAAVQGEECEATFGPGSCPELQHYFMNKVYIRGDLAGKVKVLDAGGETVHTGEGSSIENPRGAAWAAIELDPGMATDGDGQPSAPLHVIIASFHLSGGRDDDCRVAEHVAKETPEMVASVRLQQLDKLTTLMMEVQRRLQLPSAIFLFGGDANSFVPQQARVCQVGYAKMMLLEARLRLRAIGEEDEAALTGSVSCEEGEVAPSFESRQAADFAQVQKATVQLASVLAPAMPCDLADLVPLFRVPSEQEKIYKNMGDNESVPLQCSSTVNGGQVDHFYYSMRTGTLTLQNMRAKLLANKWWSLQAPRPGEWKFQKGTSDHNAIMFTGEVVSSVQTFQPKSFLNLHAPPSPPSFGPADPADPPPASW